MKKLSIISGILFGMLFMFNASASAQNFREGDLVINAGIGVGTPYSYAGSYGNSLPFGAGAEYGVTNLEKGSIGVGGEVGFFSVSGLSILYIGPKASYHFNELLEIDNDKVDLYGGLGIYFRSYNYDSQYISNANDVVAAFHIGGRYYFSDNIGVYGELGNNWAWLNLGVVFKL